MQQLQETSSDLQVSEEEKFPCMIPRPNQYGRPRRRKSYPPRRSHVAEVSRSSPRNAENRDVWTSANVCPTPISPYQGTQSDHSATIPTPETLAYVGDQSFMDPLDAHNEYPVPQLEGTARARFSRELVKAMEATTLPPRVKVEALADTYFQHLYQRAPVIDRSDLFREQPSKLICQTLCLIGSCLRHPGIQSLLEESDEYYCKAKALLFANYEVDHHQVLKALCLLSFRNITPPRVLSLESAYQWLGMATRLAYQMGLHRESTYSNLENPGSARRIIWTLCIQDKLQSACFGRPSIIVGPEFDVQPVQLSDFEDQNIQAKLFIQYMNLNMILGTIVDCHAQKGTHCLEKATNILQSLQHWINNLPDELRLYHDTERRLFRRDVHELHINYFVCIVVFCRLFGQTLARSVSSTVSLVASSCIARIYEEMHPRDEINYLMPINNWFLMVGCAPQIQQRKNNPEDELCTEELHILMTALRYMGLKWPPAKTLLGIIERLSTVDSMKPKEPSQSICSRREDDEISESRPFCQNSAIIRDLFPFPQSLSPRMGLIDEIFENFEDRFAFEHIPDLGDELNWIFDQYQHGFVEASLV
ncbi:uncharacterized protein N7511_000113 [Penicillium nucicola]|uniref:uncharacterized protein n=1 Tax=Penicillium nucicola TaxID=1850975 RepID=UPI002544DEF4|nr:uncharacterized protein N7511_000113 [Penicillium nucicola]KAJ5775102.1 hypothetical protein N7511_000113 [Penicillium nucicola]